MTKKFKIMTSLISLLIICICLVFYLNKTTFIFTSGTVYSLQPNYNGQVNNLTTVHKKTKDAFGYIIKSKEKVQEPSISSPNNKIIFGNLEIAYPNYFTKVITGTNNVTFTYQSNTTFPGLNDLMITITKLPLTPENKKIAVATSQEPGYNESPNGLFEYKISEDYIYIIQFNSLNKKYDSLNLKQSLSKSIKIL